MLDSVRCMRSSFEVLKARLSQVISETRNTVNQTKNATRHAEINAIDDVEKLGESDNIWMVVWLCSFRGSC